MEELDLKNIIEICNKTTKGPWISYIEGRDFESGSSFIKTGGDIDRDYDIEFISIRQEDQDFIAFARNIIPLLVDEVTKLRSEKYKNGR